MPASCSRLLAVAFLGLLLLPTADSLLGLSARFKSTENRRLNDRPAFDPRHPRRFVRQFGQYYKENFGGRNLLFYAYSRWKLNVLHESPLPDKVLLGKAGWLYLGNSENRVVDQHCGLLPLSDDSLRAIASRLVLRQRELTRQGIQLYVFIAPDTHTIYPEHLPSNILISPGCSRLDQLIQYVARHTTVPLIDSRDTLLAAKRHHAVYYRTDTHWNNYGSLIGCYTLFSRIRRDFPRQRLPRPDEYQFTAMPGWAGDLATMVMLDTKDSNYYDMRSAGYLNVVKTDTLTRVGQNMPDYRLTGPAHCTDQLKLWLSGDSFSLSMIQYVPSYCRQVYYTQVPALNMPLIRMERPNAVVVEVVERNIGRLVNI